MTVSKSKRKSQRDRFIETTAAVCHFFDVSAQTLTNWGRAEPPIPKMGFGKYNLKDVFLWWLENIHEDATNRDESLLEFKRQHEKERIRITRAKADTLEGRLVSRDEVIRGWCDRMRIVRSSLLQLEFRLPNLLEGMTLIEKKRIIHDECVKILEEYSRDGAYTATVAEGDVSEIEDAEAEGESE